MHLTVTKYDYLKTPSYSVTLHNDEGGSSRMGTDLRTLKAVGSHIWFTYAQPEKRCVEPSTRVFIEIWYGLDKDSNQVVTTDVTDVDALLCRIGTTRDPSLYS